jgi:hypothetical protein
MASFVFMFEILSSCDEISIEKILQHLCHHSMAYEAFDFDGSSSLHIVMYCTPFSILMAVVSKEQVFAIVFINDST